MKNIFKYFAGALFVGLSMTACSPEEFSGADQSKIPTMEGRNITVTTDQETNTAVFSISGDLNGCYPVWYLDGAVYSTLPTANYHSMSEGTHTLEVRLLNRNGLSQGSLTGGFTFNETKVDYTPYFNKLTGKEWRIDYTEKGHLGCGEPGTDGSNWWSANANDKADWGVYDDRVTFAHSDSDPADGGTYTYNPGEGGTVYVNTGCSIFADFNTNDGNDFMAEVSAQTASYTLIPGTFNDEDCLYIQFAANTLLPYIPNDETYANPYFRIEALTNSKLALVCDNGSISWRMVFTSKEDTGMPEEGDDEGETQDWVYTASSNLWASVDAGSNLVSVTNWFANDGWQQLSTDVNWSQNGDVYTVEIPDGIGNSQWQGQFAINSSLTASASKKYNFYLVMEADDDVKGATIKLTETDGPDIDPETNELRKHDSNFFVADRHDLTAGKPFVYKAEAVSLPLNDAHALTLVCDFGGAPVGTVIKISQIYFEEAMDYNADTNLWKAVDEGDYLLQVTNWFANDGWQQLSTDINWSHSGDTYTVEIPDGIGNSQWQGQFTIETSLIAKLTDSYNFSCTILADDDISGATIKLTETNGPDIDPATNEPVKHDGNYFFADRHDLTAGKPFVYTMKDVQLIQNDAHALSLVFDFGGAPVGTNVKISNIIFEKAN